MITTELVYNVTGQTVTLPYVPEWAVGVPSSPTVNVYDGLSSDDDTAEFTPTGTVEDTSTTVDQASGASQTNPRILYVASTANTEVDKYYRLANAAGQVELIYATAVSSGDYVLVKEPLKYNYTTSDTLKGIGISFTVDATWVATEANILVPGDKPYRVVWDYTVGGIARKYYTYLRLVRQPYRGLVTIYDLAEHLPDIALAEPESVQGRQLVDTINAAVERVKVDLLAVNITPDSIRDTEVLKELQRAKAIQLASNWYSPPGRDRESWVIQARDDYESLFARLTTGSLKFDTDVDGSGAATGSRSGSLWFGR